MPNNYNDSKFEHKLLNNNLLFGTIHKNKTPEDKIKKIKKYLDQGADVNATDANYKNNTPLHVAVMKEEPEVVRFLLERGAQRNIKNSDNLTAFDIVCQSGKNTCTSKDIVTMLQTFNNDKITRPSTQQDTDADLTSYSKSVNIRQDPKNPGSLVGCQIFNYKKRTGTSGLSGQLYETKLLSLILFRALYVHEVKSFSLATNVESMGAFDDIVFKFYSNNSNKPRIIFLQAKHRDNPSKDTFTVEEIMKLNGDFSLHTYLESYMKISQMFVPENCDDMFKGEFKNMDCEFIIYTPAFENFTKKKAVKQTEGKRFINTSDGKVFQFDYDEQDVECLVQTIAKSRAVLLAKRLSKLIFKDNHSNMMRDDLIKTYHVFLAQHILHVEFKDGDSQNNFRYAKFRESLFTSNHNLILAFKVTFCQEKSKHISPEEPKEVENILMSSSFKVPLNFGNLNFCIRGSKHEKIKKLQYLCSKFKKLYENANVSANIVMKVDDNMVGPNEILQSTDFESLGGLVGNLLVLDEKTKTLKFNSDIHSLSDDNLKLVERLKSDVFKGIDLSKCRFDINFHRFPRLSLVHEEYDKSLIEKFLSKITFYTNQATEGEVERILKEEIDNYFVARIPRRSDALFRLKGDAIFLKVHDRIQKWWKQPNKAPYLTEACNFFVEAERVVLNSPLLRILNFTYTKTIKNGLPEIKFRDSALELLHLDGFFKGTARILCVTTEENTLTSIKLIQCFEKTNFNDYCFIDLDYVVFRNYFVDAKLEIKESKTNTLIVVCNSDFITEMNSLIKHFKGKVIVICNRDLVLQIKKISTEDIVEIVDSQIGFKDLADKMCTMLLEERYITFQGKEVPLGILFKDESYHLINSNLLCMIINNEKIKIGSFFNNPAYDEILNSYINLQVCRYITLDPNAQGSSEFNVLKYNELDDNFKPDTRDIILITDKYEEFTEFIYTYVTCNVHWFRYNGDECIVWHKSRGSMMNLFKHIYRGAHDAYALHPVTLKDVKEKVVIISGEPGMGKSSLLTHLAIGTKHKFPMLWISKINLHDYTYEFRRMKETKVSIDFKEAVKFLFRVIEFEIPYKERKAKLDNIIDQVSVVSDNISFNKNEGKLNITGRNLFEIELFIHCYNSGRVVLLFDGFDEICPDFANEFMQLINILKKSKVAHLWITSRLYNVLHQLENTLETFSFTILPLRFDDQLEFLEKIWLRKFSSTKLGGRLVDKEVMHDFVESFLRKLFIGLRDPNSKFLSIPLHLYMISEIFQDSFHKLNIETVRSVINLNRLYELFVDVKFSKIRFGEKKPLLCVNDPDIRELISNERKHFLYAHKIIGAYVIFGETALLLGRREINAKDDFIQRINVGREKTGIIEQVIQNIPKFVHYSFAEYFAVEFLCDKLKSPHWKSSWTFFINSFLPYLGSRPPLSWSFFNAKLGNDPLIFNETVNADLNKMFATLLFEYNQLAWLLCTCIIYDFENIAIFLLKCVKPVLSKKYLNDFINVVVRLPHLWNNSKSCILCNAAILRRQSFVTFVFELIKDLDLNRLFDLLYCIDYPRFNVISVGFGLFHRKSLFCGLYHGDWLNVILPDLPPPLIVELFCMQLSPTNLHNKCTGSNILNKSASFIHILAPVIGKAIGKCIDKGLEKLNNEQLMTIFCSKDYAKRLPAHYAAFYQAFEFFEKLKSLLERSQLMKTCMALDGSGRAPIHYFRYTKNEYDKVYSIANDLAHLRGGNRTTPAHPRFYYQIRNARASPKRRLKNMQRRLGRHFCIRFQKIYLRQFFIHYLSTKKDCDKEYSIANDLEHLCGGKHITPAHLRFYYQIRHALATPKRSKNIQGRLGRQFCIRFQKVYLRQSFRATNLAPKVDLTSYKFHWIKKKNCNVLVGKQEGKPSIRLLLRMFENGFNWKRNNNYKDINMSSLLQRYTDSENRELVEKNCVQLLASRKAP